MFTICADPYSTLLHLKMLFRGSGEQYFKSYGSTVQLSSIPHPAVKQCGESGGIRPGRSLWATAARGARLEQLMRWQHHSFPPLWPRNTSNSPTCVLKSSIKDFRGIATKIRHILTPGCAQALLFKCLSYPLIRSGNSPSKKHKSQLKYLTSFVGSVTH